MHPSAVSYQYPWRPKKHKGTTVRCPVGCTQLTPNLVLCVCVCVCVWVRVNLGIHLWLAVSKAFVALVEHPCCVRAHSIFVCLCMHAHHATSLPNSLNLHYSARLENAPFLLWRDEKMSGVPQNTSETGRNEDGGWSDGDSRYVEVRQAVLWPDGWWFEPPDTVFSPTTFTN